MLCRLWLGPDSKSASGASAQSNVLLRPAIEDSATSASAHNRLHPAINSRADQGGSTHTRRSVRLKPSPGPSGGIASVSSRAIRRENASDAPGQTAVAVDSSVLSTDQAPPDVKLNTGDALARRGGAVSTGIIEGNGDRVDKGGVSLSHVTHSPIVFPLHSPHCVKL